MLIAYCFSFSLVHAAMFGLIQSDAIAAGHCGLMRAVSPSRYDQAAHRVERITAGGGRFALDFGDVDLWMPAIDDVIELGMDAMPFIVRELGRDIDDDRFVRLYVAARAIARKHRVPLDRTVVGLKGTNDNWRIVVWWGPRGRDEVRSAVRRAHIQWITRMLTRRNPPGVGAGPTSAVP